MTKQEFLDQLRAGLAGMPPKDVEERIEFYGEMIDDRMEEGLSEEDAVLAVGSVERIVDQILAETPLAKLAKEKIKPTRALRAWEIVLLALGSPLWIVLLAAAFVIVLALYAVLWSLIASLWAVFGALAGGGIGFVVGGGILALTGRPAAGLALVGGGLILSGLAILLFLGCVLATRGTAILSKKIVLGIKKCFVRREKTK